MVACKNTEPSIFKMPEVISYRGMIGCVTVPNGTVIVRRNGIPCVCGNSYEKYFQCVCRSNRVGSTKTLNVHMPATDIELEMIEVVFKKADRVQADTEAQERIFKKVSAG